MARGVTLRAGGGAVSGVNNGLTELCGAWGRKLLLDDFKRRLAIIGGCTMSSADAPWDARFCERDGIPERLIVRMTRFFDLFQHLAEIIGFRCLQGGIRHVGLQLLEPQQLAQGHHAKSTVHEGCARRGQ
jgi:hypothetical protein